MSFNINKLRIIESNIDKLRIGHPSMVEVECTVLNILRSGPIPAKMGAQLRLLAVGHNSSDRINVIYSGRYTASISGRYIFITSFGFGWPSSL